MLPASFFFSNRTTHYSTVIYSFLYSLFLVIFLPQKRHSRGEKTDFRPLARPTLSSVTHNIFLNYAFMSIIIRIFARSNL